MSVKKIFAISGSTRTNSSNLNLIRAIADLTTNKFSFTIFGALGELPHFNPDEEGADSAVLQEFRQALSKADGVLICTPEYAHGVPGSLKNAIDWTVGTGEFSQKPTLLITASTDGSFGHQALLETLRVIEAKNIDELQLLIQYVRSKVSPDAKIIDEPTKNQIIDLLNKFELTIKSDLPN